MPFVSPAADVRLCGRCNATLVVPVSMIKAAGDITAEVRRTRLLVGPERDQTSELQLEAEKSVIRCDEEILKLQAVMKQLEDQRTKLQQLVDGYRCLQAPVRRLPNELLYEVFSSYNWTSGPYSDSWNTPIENAKGLSPLALGRVCARWRDLALSSPRLWTYISLTLESPQMDAARVAARTGALKTYLERSAQLPLSIQVDVNRTAIWGPSDSDSDAGSEDAEPEVTGYISYYPFHPLLSLLATQSRRWRCVELSLEASYFSDHEALAPIRGNLPLLEVLRMDPDIMEITHFETCPKLSQVTIPSDTTLQIPWVQLTKVTVTTGHWDQDDVLNILHICSQLIRFDTGISFTGNPFPETSSNLESLSIRTDPGEELERPTGLASFFDAITLPRLKSLMVYAQKTHAGLLWEQETWRTWPHHAFVSFLRRSSCPLDYLALDGISPTNNGDLREVVELVPSLCKMNSNT